MLNLKSQLLQELKNARDDLWNTLDRLDDETVIYPGWKKQEFFAHVAGWEAMVFDVFRRHIEGQEVKDYAYEGINKANERFVAVRKSMTLQDTKWECEINRFAIIQLLESIDDYGEVITFPWGKNTVSEFIQGAIEHERDHNNDIQQLDDFQLKS